MKLLPQASKRLKDFLRSHDFYVALYETVQPREEYTPFGEVKAKGYSAGGKRVEVGEDLSAKDVCWPNSSIVAKSALLYDKATGIGFGFGVFPKPVSSTRDDFKICFGDGLLFTED